MQEAGAISAYAESLAAKLGFDRPLQRCVRDEVEDHLREAVLADAAADPAGDPLEAQRRAIARFGDPQVIAAQFALASLAGQTRKIGSTVILVMACVFLAMATRVAWYDLTEWALCEAAMPLSDTVGLIDRSAFLLAVIGGIAGWACRERPRWFRALCALATGALAVSVISDGVLTALRLSGWEFSVDFLVPLFSMAVEFACAAVLMVHLRSITRRLSSTEALVS
jgi:hypothetical protein